MLLVLLCFSFGVWFAWGFWFSVPFWVLVVPGLFGVPSPSKAFPSYELLYLSLGDSYFERRTLFLELRFSILVFWQKLKFVKGFTFLS